MPQLVIEYPAHLPDVLNQTRNEFEKEASLQLAIRLYEVGKLSSGQAAALVGMERVPFLLQLSAHQSPMIHYDPEELAEELRHV
jgi:predicted HTH domain antitoxin